MKTRTILPVVRNSVAPDPVAERLQPNWEGSDPGVWRCSECGHGRFLDAYARALVRGPVDSDGLVNQYDYDDCDTIEESITCRVHADQFVPEKRVNGRWCRWHDCTRCHGSGTIPGPGKGLGAWACPGDGSVGPMWTVVAGMTPGHGEWRPVDE